MLSSAAMEVEGSCGEEIAIKQCDSQMEISKSCRVLGSEEKKKWILSLTDEAPTRPEAPEGYAAL
jgi:hypothetical protein